MSENCDPLAKTAGFVLLRATTETASAYNQVAAFRNSGGDLNVGTPWNTQDATNSSDQQERTRKTLRAQGELSPVVTFSPESLGYGLIEADYRDNDCYWPYAIYNTETQMWFKFDAQITEFTPTIKFGDNEITRMLKIKFRNEERGTGQLSVEELTA